MYPKQVHFLNLGKLVVKCKFKCVLLVHTEGVYYINLHNSTFLSGLNS